MPLFAPRRALTPAEVDLVRPLFGHGLDYAKVRIQSGGWFGLPHLTRAALAHGNTLVFPPRQAHHDFANGSDADKMWLAHEVAHIWQWQLGLRLWRHGAALALRGGYGRQQRAYRYQHLLCGKLRLPDLNMEQQADLLAHYFDAAFLAGDGSVANHSRHVACLPLYRCVLQDFLVDPRNAALLPANAPRKRTSSRRCASASGG